MKQFIKFILLSLLFILVQRISYGQTLGAVKGNYLQINAFTGNAGGNTFYNKQWLVRNAAGPDWLTASLHDGIAIDGSFHVPMSTSKTWWERNPYLGIQSWGSGAETYMTLKEGHLSLNTPTNGWVLSSKATVTNAGEYNGIKLLTGYPNDTNKWAAVVATAEDLHSNSTGLALYSSALERIRIAGNGNVGIGTTTPKAKLAVEGNILAKEIKVKTDISVPDYVFEPDYKIRSLSEIENYVKEHKHLPEVPSAKEIGEEGLDLAEMNLLLLKKVEELTLHLIEERKGREELARYCNQRIMVLEEKLGNLSADKPNYK
ncbi:hypothetical protein FKG96_06190 [Olivibacter sp. LS-1]|uniref:hypothetical protein n=1 Tax=Olivibacter sp. LS-1 TaxID=2592345 RepID=UPI0011EB651A|nr:hypothetical protein [Olivibacter sp. LS-1]QEL00415.1 hypothetical protein FKG96_06190 [Olivibacter sp. LS-1]